MATESQFTISPRKSSASASESAVFPLPVGPSTTTSRDSVDTRERLMQWDAKSENQNERTENQNARGLQLVHVRLGRPSRRRAIRLWSRLYCSAVSAPCAAPPRC